MFEMFGSVTCPWHAQRSHAVMVKRGCYHDCCVTGISLRTWERSRTQRRSEEPVRPDSNESIRIAVIRRSLRIFGTTLSTSHQSFPMPLNSGSARQDSGISNLIDDADWLQQSEPIANEMLDFDTLFLRIFKPTDISELHAGGDAQSCSSNIAPRLANSPDLANTSEPMSRAKTQNLDLASMPPPTILLSKRKSSKLSSARAELC